MNKRDFVTGGVAAVVGAPVLAGSEPAASGRVPLARLLARTQRLPDLIEHPGATAFEAYAGETFAIVGGASDGARLVLTGIERVARCTSTEQFNLAFATAASADKRLLADGLRTLSHATGQQLALYLERTGTGYRATFNLLA